MRRWYAIGVLLCAVSAHAAPAICPATDLASLQACIHTAPEVSDTSRSDTVLVIVAPGTYSGAQVRINRRKNLWVVGDTTADEATQPRILFQDRQHVYTDLDAAKRADTSATGTYGQNNGTVWIHESDNIRLMGLLIDGNSSTSRTNTAGRIFAYGATLGKANPVEIRGNVGVNILLSRNVQLRYLSVTNAWNGISIISPNLGGAFSFPDPNDPVEELVATLPTSRAGLYGSHLIERCRIHDNVFGILFQRDWDLGSVVRNNLFWGNYLRHWGDTRTPKDYIQDLEILDKGKRADGSARSIAYTTVGGAFLMNDVALTPYRVHNNTFHQNATIFSGYYKAGTQHLFYNNLVGRPYQFFRRALDLPVEATDAAYNSFRYGYTQTERNSEMLQYMSEHQRSNRVVAQDSIPANTAVAPDYWGVAGGNFRLYNMRQIRRGPTQYEGWNWRGNARSWSNAVGEQDSLSMTWVPDTAAAGTIAQQADTGGVVRWIRHNMWAGAQKDAMDPNVGQNWSPPWLPIAIRPSLADPKVFRETSAFDVRWTLAMPLDTVSSPTSASWLRPLVGSRLGLAGWRGYEGTPTQALSIGAYDPAGGWAAPARRLVLRDTLVETVTDSMVRFRMNVSGQGISDSDIVSLVVHEAKFYNDVPVSDTLYNQGPNAAGTGTTTRVNSVLSSKAWPLPYQFLSTDYNRTGYSVDDSLTRRKLAPDNIFLARVGAGYRLPSDSLYARAEVVLKATLKDGTVIYSNPGVFMFSRPRFQFDVKVVDAATGVELPLDADGISRVAQAYQSLRVMVKAKTVASLPVAFKGYGNVQMGSAGDLHGPDGDQLQAQRAGAWAPRHPNDTVFTYFAQNDSVYDTLRAQVSPSNGTFVYRAVFIDMNGKALPYFIEGRSVPVRVVSGAIYQVTIDSVLRDDTLALSSPSVALKVHANEVFGGRRDTLLQRGGETSRNVTRATRGGETLRLVLQVRDKHGNPVRDSSSVQKGLYIRLAQVLATGRYADAAPDLSWLSIDSSGASRQSVRLEFDSAGRAVATVRMSDFPYRSVLAPLKAAIVDAQDREIGRGGASRDSGIADTTWIRTGKIDLSLAWTDTLGVAFRPARAMWVGEWIPVRLKLRDNGAGRIWTGSVDVSSSAPVGFHASRDGAGIAKVAFAGDSLSGVVWIRATDSVTGAWIAAHGLDVSDTVDRLDFRYPSAAGASFHDRDCDGRVDRVVVKLDGPVLFRADTGVVAGDSVDARFPHQHLSPSALKAPDAVRFGSDSSVTFTWNPAGAGTASIRADRVLLGNPLLPGRSLALQLAALQDKAPPVALSASVRQTRTGGVQTDSLVVRFSETIDARSFVQGAAAPFAIVRAGTRIPLRQTRLVRPVAALDSGVYAFVFQGGAGLLRRGDSIAIDSSSVVDLAGNRSGDICPNNAIHLSFLPIYRVTIDTVQRGDGTVLSTPSLRTKIALDAQGGRRDTLLVGAGDSSLNVGAVKNGARIRLVLQVRDELGNPVGDTARLLDGAALRVAHVLAAGRYPDANTNPARVFLDSAGASSGSVRLEFDSTGRAVATVLVSELPTAPVLVAIRAALVDREGRDMGAPATPLDSAISDTTWLRTPPWTRSVSWVDTSGAPLRISQALVGEWLPVRLKIVDGPSGRIHTGDLAVAAMLPVGFHPSRGDTSAVSRIVFSGDSLSGVLWIRATDSVTDAWIRANGDSLADTLGGIDFRYPQARSATFHDQDCDGRVDMLRVLMDGPVLFRPDTGLVAGDSVEARFPHQHLSPSARGSLESFRIASESTLVVSWDPALAGASAGQTDRIVLGNPLASGRSVSIAIPTLHDKAPPVGISGVDRQTWTDGQTDSLKVRFSETIVASAFPAGAALPFVVVRDGKRASLRDVRLASAATAIDSGTYLFVFRGAVGRLKEGDSLAIDSTLVSDLAGNLSGTTCPNKPFHLGFQPRYEPTQGYVIDVDGDGNADSVHLGFADSLGALPEKIFVRWGTPPETLTVTRSQLEALGVRTSDSAFTVPTRGWRGQTVIIGRDTLHNVPRTAGPWDSAWFEDGVVREWLADRVAPVVIRARMAWAVSILDTLPEDASLQDTLVVDFSEAVAGCAVGSDPKRCLAGQGIGRPSNSWSGDAIFPDGSKLLRSVGSQWTILVPRTPSSIVPGDSLKAAPKSVGGRLTDTTESLNVPGDRTPSVVVRGDPAPPSSGSMLDRDGDGRVDAVLLRYKVPTRAAVLPSFAFDWCDSSGAAATLRSDSSYQVDSLRWIAVLDRPGAFPATGCAASATSLANGRQLTGTVYAFPVRDSAGAVLHPWARLKPSSSKDGLDTIVVRPSEPLRDPTGSVLLEFRRGGAAVPADSVDFRSATRGADGTWIVVVGGSYRPSPGDQVRLSTTGSVLDAAASRNRPHPDHPWVVLAGNFRVPYASAYRDTDKDGRIETAVFEFASAPLPGTRIRVSDPSGSRAWREYVVKASDSGRTHLEFSFPDSAWGQDVTSLVRPDLGLLLPPYGFDTTVFLGGVFPIRDEVEPVLRTARLRFTSDTSGVDTLVLHVSERIVLDPSKGVVRFRASSDLSDSGYAVFIDPRYKDRIVYDSAKGTITMFLKPFPRGATNPVSGDSMRLSWEGVRDTSGNRPGPVAKWVEVVANERIFPPSLKVTNSMVRGPGYSGTPVDGPQFEIVARPSTPQGDAHWQRLGPSGWTPGGSAYTPSLPGSTRSDREGTVIFIQTNVPTTLMFYIYDNLGTFVGQKTEHVTKAMLDQLPRSPIGLVDVGVLWKGQGQDGRLVGTGVYLIRLIAQRDPLPSERGQSAGSNSFFNRIVNVGVDVGR